MRGIPQSAVSRKLARHIKREMGAKHAHCAIIYEDELERIWPADDENREAKIAQFAKKYGFRVRYYTKGLCAIFDKAP